MSIPKPVRSNDKINHANPSGHLITEIHYTFLGLAGVREVIAGSLPKVHAVGGIPA